MLEFYRKLIKKRALADYGNAADSIDALLVDTPVHGNIGDQAIALAERDLLDTVLGADKYCELTSAEIDGWEDDFAQVTPSNCLVFVHGGGFLGSLWPEEESRFRKILEAFRGHRIVVLPQTAYFDEADGGKCRKESRRFYEKHPNLTICARERMSFDTLTSMLDGVDVRLVPDSVLTLRTQGVSPGESDRKGVLLCLRSDKERVLGESDAAGIEKQIKEALGPVSITHTDMIAKGVVRPGRRRALVEGKLREFAGAKLVVTDRLHGMIFAALVGTPCIALGNCSGKVKAVYRWLADLDYVVYLDDVRHIESAVGCLDLDSPRSFDAAPWFERLSSEIAAFCKNTDSETAS